MSIKFKDLNFDFSETSPEKILNMSEVLNPSKAAGIDKLSVKILNSRVDILARSITVISLSNLIRSPEVLKFQNSNHFFKRAPTLILKTIVQFHTLSKVSERIAHDQTQECFSKNKIPYTFQSGLRKNYSTNTCLGHVLLIKSLPVLKKVYLLE